MIARQFRLLIIAAEIVSEGGYLETVQHEMNTAEWLAQRVHAPGTPLFPA